MRLLAKCPVCHKRRLFIKTWAYSHFFAGMIYDKAENEKCYWCKRTLQKTLDAMKP